MNPNPWLTKIVALAVAVVLSGLPVMAQTVSSQPAQQQAEPAQQPNNGRVDPTAGPKTPLPSSELPDHPQPSDQAAPAPQAQTPAESTPQTSGEQQTSQEPLGTAAAQGGSTAGGPGSKPAGMAIAPAKQKQTRSLLIKIGAIAAAGAALGIVYGLTRATPSTPPGAPAAASK